MKACCCGCCGDVARLVWGVIRRGQEDVRMWHYTRPGHPDTRGHGHCEMRGDETLLCHHHNIAHVIPMLRIHRITVNILGSMFMSIIAILVRSTILWIWQGNGEMWNVREMWQRHYCLIRTQLSSYHDGRFKVKWVDMCSLVTFICSRFFCQCVEVYVGCEAGNTFISPNITDMWDMPHWHSLKCRSVCQYWHSGRPCAISES